MLDYPGDICERCRHALRPEGVCPSCGWRRPRTTEGQVLADELEAWLRDREVGGSP